MININKYKKENQSGEFNQKLSFLFFWTFIVLSYIFVEWIYNQHLLSLLIITSIKPNNFYYTEIFGKIIASIGLNLIIKETFRYKGWFIFIIGTVFSYFLLSLFFTYLINSFSNEFKNDSYYSLSHRETVLLKKDDYHLLQSFDNQEWFKKPLFMSYFILQKPHLKLEKTKKEYQEPFLNKLKDFSQNKEKYWNQYKKAMNGKKSLSEGWFKYQSAMFKYNQYKKTRYSKKAYSEFKRIVKMEPNLTENEFYQLNGKDYLKFLNTEFFPGLELANIQPIYGKDIPTYFDQNSFYSYGEREIQNLQFKVAPKIQDMQYHSLGKDAVSLFVIPPISIGLSLFSIILNFIFLIAMWLHLFVYYTTFSTKKVLSFYFFIAVLFFSISYHLLPNHLNEHPKWKEPIENFYSNNKIYEYFINFTLKFEPLLCFDKPNEVIQKTTHNLYNK